MIRSASFESLADTSQAPMVFDVWLAAEEGDYSGMALLTLAGPMMFAEATIWGDNTAKNTSTGDYALGTDYQTSFNPPDSIIGSPRSELAASMEGWPATIISQEYRQVQPLDVETLLVSGSIDFWTPAQLAEQDLLPFLSKGQHVVVAEAGHGEMLWQQPEASRHLLNTFYDTGVGDDALFTYHPWEFKVGFGFPLMAKLVLAAIVLLIAIVVAAVGYIARRVRQHRTRQVSN
jgi:pimeloyl-ACP methyl ester carboxylesterase